MKNTFKIVLAIIFFLFIWTGIIFFSFRHIYNDLPEVESLKNYQPLLITRFKAKSGETLLELAKENRILKGIKEIPPKVIQAVVAAEDDEFYQHKGLNFKGLSRAFFNNVKAGKIKGGGSTITQQVAKNFLLSHEQSYVRKIKDIMLALKIEKNLSKDEILYLYLNQVYFGSGAYGVAAAAKTYFNKDLEKLTWAESALIAGLLPAPGKYSPFVGPTMAKNRQHYVLGRLLELGKITKKEYEIAMNERVRLYNERRKEYVGGYFVDYLRWKLAQEVGEEAVMTMGFDVVTTLDYNLQKSAEKAVALGAKNLDQDLGYRGPLYSIASDKFSSENQKIKMEILKKESQILFLEANGTITYSQVGEDNKDHSFADYLEVSKDYQAIVTNVRDDLKVAFISIGGEQGFIDASGFSWAKPHRNIKDRLEYNQNNISLPSKVFNKGDVIWVSVKEKNVSLKSQNNLTEKEKVYFSANHFIKASLTQKPLVQASLVAIDPATGAVLAMVGGTDFRDSQFNRAIQAKRQPGSAFKPFIYAAALEKGMTPSTIIMDTPYAMGGTEKNLSWKPNNSDGKFMGAITLRKALELSRNIPAIKVLQEIGINKIREFVKRIKLDVELPRDLSISLGTFGVSLLELTKAYSIFPSGGKYVEPKFLISIKDHFGKNYFDKETINQSVREAPASVAEPLVGDFEVAAEHDPDLDTTKKLDSKQVYDSRLAAVMTSLLQGVVQSGTAAKANVLGAPLAGKTGTTNDNNDAWFIGFAPKIIVGVWTGMDDNSTLGHRATGGAAALPIWIDFMRDYLATHGRNDFILPSGVARYPINKASGQPADSADPNAFYELFMVGTENQATPTNSEEESKTIFSNDDFFNN